MEEAVVEMGARRGTPGGHHCSCYEIGAVGEVVEGKRL